MNKKNNRKGFTIVELVIVIAVIAILAAVLVPTFGNVIENANKSAAEQEAKNIYTNYVVSAAEEGTYLSDVVVEVDEYYVTIDDGAVVSSKTSKDAPSGEYVLLTAGEDGAVVTSAVNATSTSN